VRIDGKFNGEIFSKDVLVIGESAEVRAEISVGTVVINGKVAEGKVLLADGDRVDVYELLGGG